MTGVLDTEYAKSLNSELNLIAPGQPRKPKRSAEEIAKSDQRKTKKNKVVYRRLLARNSRYQLEFTMKALVDLIKESEIIKEGQLPRDQRHQKAPAYFEIN